MADRCQAYDAPSVATGISGNGTYVSTCYTPRSKHYILGFGLSPEQPAIGVILSESMKYLTMGKWWLALFPGILLVLVVMLFHVIGDTLNSLLDPSRAHE